MGTFLISNQDFLYTTKFKSKYCLAFLYYIVSRNLPCTLQCFEGIRLWEWLHSGVQEARRDTATAVSSRTEAGLQSYSERWGRAPSWVAETSARKTQRYVQYRNVQFLNLENMFNIYYSTGWLYLPFSGIWVFTVNYITYFINN